MRTENNVLLSVHKFLRYQNAKTQAKHLACKIPDKGNHKHLTRNVYYEYFRASEMAKH